MLLKVPALILTGIIIIVVGVLTLAIVLVVAFRAKGRRDEEAANTKDPNIPEA
jgi:multisubunit Na+/H+ antiporter MnhC subunit